MPVLEASGTQTATLTTEHTLATLTGTQNYVLVVDTANLANNETLELKIYSKVLSAGSERLVYQRRFKHAQAEPIKVSIPVPSDVSWKATLTQTGGTGRSYDWKVLSV